MTVENNDPYPYDYLTPCAIDGVNEEEFASLNLQTSFSQHFLRNLYPLSEQETARQSRKRDRE